MKNYNGPQSIGPSSVNGARVAKAGELPAGEPGYDGVEVVRPKPVGTRPRRRHHPADVVESTDDAGPDRPRRTNPPVPLAPDSPVEAYKVATEYLRQGESAARDWMGVGNAEVSSTQSLLDAAQTLTALLQRIAAPTAEVGASQSAPNRPKRPVGWQEDVQQTVDGREPGPDGNDEEDDRTPDTQVQGPVIAAGPTLPGIANFIGEAEALFPPDPVPLLP